MVVQRKSNAPAGRGGCLFSELAQKHLTRNVMTSKKVLFRATRPIISTRYVALKQTCTRYVLVKSVITTRCCSCYSPLEKLNRSEIIEPKGGTPQQYHGIAHSSTEIF